MGSTVDSSPAELAITFDNPIEALFAKLEVLDRSGRSETLSEPAAANDHRQLAVKLKPLAPGEYTVKWSVVGEDGHRTQGSFTFSVAAGS